MSDIDWDNPAAWKLAEQIVETIAPSGWDSEDRGESCMAVYPLVLPYVEGSYSPPPHSRPEKGTA